MASDHDEVSGRVPERERELVAILAAYFEAAEVGEAPDRTDWLARHPDFANDIVRFMDEQDRLLRLTEPLRTIAEASDDSVDDLAQVYRRTNWRPWFRVGLGNRIARRAEA